MDNPEKPSTQGTHGEKRSKTKNNTIYVRHHYANKHK